MMRALFIVGLAFAALAVVLASEVEDLGAQPVAAKQKAPLGEAAKTRVKQSFGGALMTSGSFTMMAAGAIDEERRREPRDELGEANDWVLTDARDHSMGKCVKFAADSKCAPQCFHEGKEA